MVTNEQNELSVTSSNKPNFAVHELVIGCVADNTPKYLSQALRLVKSVRWYGGKMADAKFIVCIVDGVDSAHVSEFQQYSVDIRIVERFSEKHPQSNKLRFLQQPDLKDYGNILLLDCDTIVVQDPSDYIQTECFRAKLADGPTTPGQIFEKLFEFFELPLPKEDYKCTVRDIPTIPYFNAGVLLFSSSSLSRLVPVWIEMNRILIDNLEALIPWSCNANFCEQASLSLALAATGVQFDLFGNNMNFPIHHANYFSTLENTDPVIIHYHNMVDASGYIKHSLYELANKRVQQFNTRLKSEI